MVSDRQHILEAALALSHDDRTHLIDQLHESLDRQHREEIDLAWADEAERRLAVLDQGTAHAVAGERVLRRLNLGQRP